MPSIANGTAQRPSPTMLSPLRSFIALIIVILLPLHIPQMDIQHQHGYYHYRYVRIPEYTGKRSHICKNPWRIALKINATASNIAARIKSSVVTFTPMLICSVLSLAEHKIHTSAAMSSKAKMIVRSAPELYRLDCDSQKSKWRKHKAGSNALVHGALLSSVRETPHPSILIWLLRSPRRIFAGGVPSPPLRTLFET